MPLLTSTSSRRVGLVVVTFALGVCVGALWEVFEWAGDEWAGTTLTRGESDTIGDLVADSLGAALGGAGLAPWSARGWATTRRAPPGGTAS